MSQQQLKIAFLGGPGVGKTTLINHFRQVDEATVVDEAARDYFSLYPDVDRSAYETQELLLAHIKERESAASAFGTKLIVCDRSIVDPLVYLYHYGQKNEARQLISSIKDYISSYHKLYLLDPHEVRYVQDKVRNESPEERLEIHQAYLELLELGGVEYELLSGNVKKRLQIVMDHLKELGY